MSTIYTAIPPSTFTSFGALAPIASPNLSAAPSLMTKVADFAKTAFNYASILGQGLFFVCLGLRDLIVRKINPIPDHFSAQLKSFKNPLFGERAAGFFDSAAYPLLKGSLFLASGVFSVAGAVHQVAGYQANLFSGAMNVLAPATFVFTNILLFIQYARVLCQTIFLLETANPKEKELLEKIFASSITGLVSTFCYILSTLAFMFPPLTVLGIILCIIGILGDTAHFVIDFFSGVAEEKLLSGTP